VQRTLGTTVAVVAAVERLLLLWVSVLSGLLAVSDWVLL
jgi:hypothetical protein